MKSVVHTVLDAVVRIVVKRDYARHCYAPSHNGTDVASSVVGFCVIL
jgi:hypothetical protein